MKKLFLVCYFNEMEGENDADVVIIGKEDQRESFKMFFKETYGYEIKDEHILNLYEITDAFDSDGNQYSVDINKK